MRSLDPRAVNQSNSVPCRNKDCQRLLYGPVAFCPYCGLSKPTVEDKSAPRRTREDLVEAVTVMTPRSATRAPEPAVSQVTPPQRQGGSRTESGEGPAAQTEANTTRGATDTAQAVGGTPGAGRSLRPTAPRFNKRYIALGLLVAWGVYYFWPSRGEIPTPVPAPASEPLPAPAQTVTPPPVEPKPRPEPGLTDQEICAVASTSGDRADFTGRVINRPSGARLAVFHVRHGPREITCAVDRIDTEELPKAVAAARRAPDRSELKINLSHTVQELQRAQRAMTPPPLPPPPLPPQPALRWMKGLVTGLSTEGWPVMNGKVYPIYGVKPIPQEVGRERFRDWLVKTHAAQLECREHEQSGTYDCRVTPSNNPSADIGSRPTYVDVAETLIKNGATTPSVGADSN